MTVVLVPWRPTPEREPLWEHVRAHLEGLGLPIFTGDSDTELFSLSQAFNVAADRPWTRAVLTEADAWVPLEQIHAGLELPGLTYCYDRQVRYTPDETKRFLETGEWPARDLLPAQSHLGSNGVRTITRELWDEVGGYDPRFIGWGAEDVDFVHRCGQTNRIPGPMWELGHEREPAYYQARHANRTLLRKTMT